MPLRFHDLPNQCRDIDQASWALVQDLKQRGLLDDTLVIWGGEFGRTSVLCVRQEQGCEGRRPTEGLLGDPGDPVDLLNGDLQRLRGDQ